MILIISRNWYEVHFQQQQQKNNKEIQKLSQMLTFHQFMFYL